MPLQQRCRHSIRPQVPRNSRQKPFRMNDHHTSVNTAVYDASGRDRIALSAWRVMFSEIRDCRELIYRLLVRNIAGQFRQSFLGYVWIVLPPLATALVFTLLQRAHIVSVEMTADALPYFLFVMLGSMVWGYFTQFSSMATTSISSAGPLVSKIYFPREVLVISGAGIAVINLLVRLLVFVLALAIAGYAVSWKAVYCLPLMIPLTFLALGVGFVFAPINAMMNDVSRVLEFLFGFGMFLTPAVFPTPELAPETGLSNVVLFWAHHLNPVSYYLYAMHELLETGALTMGPGLVATIIFSFLVFFLGWRFFHICEPLLAERI